MKFVQDTCILALLFLALYFVALALKYAIDIQPRAVAKAFEAIR